MSSGLHMHACEHVHTHAPPHTDVYSHTHTYSCLLIHTHTQLFIHQSSHYSNPRWLQSQVTQEERVKEAKTRDKQATCNQLVSTLLQKYTQIQGGSSAIPIFPELKGTHQHCCFMIFMAGQSFFWLLLCQHRCLWVPRCFRCLTWGCSGEVELIKVTHMGRSYFALFLLE